MERLPLDSLYEILVNSNFDSIFNLSQTNANLRKKIRSIFQNDVMLLKLKSKIVYETITKFDPTLEQQIILILGYDYEYKPAVVKFNKTFLKLFTDQELRNVIYDSHFDKLKNPAINYNKLTIHQLINQLSIDIPFDGITTIETFFPDRGEEDETFYSVFDDAYDDYVNATLKYHEKIVKNASYQQLLTVLESLNNPQLLKIVITKLDKMDLMLYGRLPSNSDIVKISQKMI